jgi:hypothetical protein
MGRIRSSTPKTASRRSDSIKREARAADRDGSSTPGFPQHHSEFPEESASAEACNHPPARSRLADEFNLTGLDDIEMVSGLAFVENDFART